VRCIQAACRDLGVAVPSDADAAYVIGLGLHDALQHAVPGLPPSATPSWAALPPPLLCAPARPGAVPGTLEMLQALKARNHWLAVATGKSRRGLDEALARSQLAGLFDATRTADETAGKPHPQMLLELMANSAPTPERTLMIGDTTHDLQLAANAGTAAWGVSFGAHEAEAFERARCRCSSRTARANCTTGCWRHG
jgi:phosphoglycolate phosphatase